MKDEYLIDTNILINYLKNIEKYVRFLETQGKVTVSFVTVGELFRGARDKMELKKLKKTISNFSVLPANSEISKLSVELIEKFTLSHGLSVLDSIIAATAINNNLKLATLNVKHFQMIKELKVEKV